MITLASGYYEGSDNNDSVFGSQFADEIHGNGGNDSMWGGDGNDFLFGDAGNDRLSGGAGNDFLEGGAGADVLTGGSGNDKFVLNWGDGADTITDFQPGADKIGLGVGFTEPYGLAPRMRGSFGADGELRTGTDVASGPWFHGYDAPDTLFYDTDDHRLYQVSYDYANGTVQADLLATFTNGVQLQTSDFFFV